MSASAEDQGLELRMMMRIGRLLPRAPHASGVVNRLLKPIYLRRTRPDTVADVLGFKMQLQPSEAIDGALLFCPQLYDPHEVDFVRRTLKPGDTFLDIGTNIGFYSLIAAGIVGDSGRVLSVEADPFNFGKFQRNIALNHFKSIKPLNVGVSDRVETLRLGLQTHGNRGGNSFLESNSEGVEVECKPLLDVMTENAISSVKLAKLDIEGFEYRVLKPFLADAPRSLYPRWIIVEFAESWTEKMGGNPIELLKSHGYVQRSLHGNNYILELGSAGE